MIKKITLLSIFLFVLTAKAQTENYTILNLKINNKYSNFGTTFYGNNQVVYASPRNKSYIIRNVWKGNNQPFLDLFIGNISKNGQLIGIENFSKRINSRYHEADVTFTKDKKTVYFSRNNYLNKEYKKDSTGVNLIQLYRAKINTKGEWSNLEPMPFNNNHFQTGHPTLSKDEKTLYFISDMPGGFGKTDIYKVLINEDGSVGDPVNLGPEINTSEREMFPFIRGNDILYYSSNGREDGFGGLDVYVTKISRHGIAKPQNLGIPINSAKDDFAFIISQTAENGYFSSNRKGGKGDDDIYAFIQNTPVKFECNQKVKGVITDSNSGELLPGSLVVLFDEYNTKISSIIVENDATFSFEIDCYKAYKVEGSKKGYSTAIKKFTSINEEDFELSLAIKLEDFEVIDEKLIVKINPIYFDLDKYNIRPDAEIELNKVVEVMKKFPKIVIEGGSHTDSRGSDKYNEKLSENRAKSTIQYIISRGISASRISARGFGETQLVNKCSNGVKCSGVEHQQNRRTEFVVVNPEVIK